MTGSEEDRQTVRGTVFPDERAGRIALETRKLRKGSYLPSFIEPRRTAEKALVALAIVTRSCQRMRHRSEHRWRRRSNGSLQEACVQGISTRSVDDLVKAEGYIDSRDFEIVCTFAGFDPDAVAARFEPETYRDAMKAMQLRAA